MSKKTIKIPQGQIQVMFENNGQSFEVTDKILWNALCDHIFKGEETKEKPEEISRPDFNDEHPDYIRASEEEI